MQEVKIQSTRDLKKAPDTSTATLSAGRNTIMSKSKGMSYNGPVWNIIIPVTLPVSKFNPLGSNRLILFVDGFISWLPVPHQAQKSLSQKPCNHTCVNEYVCVLCLSPAML